MAEACVFVSIGQHPRSHRPRRADADARALSLALGLRRAGAVRKVTAIYCGVGNDRILTEYAAMGPDAILRYAVPAGQDILPAMIAHVRAEDPALILTGNATEQGESSGFLPYALAQGTDRALIPNLAKITPLAGGGIEMVEALPNGYRQAFRVARPVVATVGLQAPAALPSVFARARSAVISEGRLDGENSVSPPVNLRPGAARPIGKRLPASASLAERRQAALSTHGMGKILTGSADDIARQIWDYLVSEGIVRARDTAE